MTDSNITINKKFRAALARDAALLRCHANEVSSRNECSQALQSIRSIAHKLAGRSGILGLTHIGEHAAMLEALIEGRSKAATIRASCEDLVSAMRSAID